MIGLEIKEIGNTKIINRCKHEEIEIRMGGKEIEVLKKSSYLEKILSEFFKHGERERCRNRSKNR